MPEEFVCYSFADGDGVKLGMKAKMEVFRRLSVILQKPEVVPPYEETTVSHEKQNVPKALADEFDKFGLMWLHTFSPCFPLDGNKVMIL
jgi:hypothetical protein